MRAFKGISAVSLPVMGLMAGLLFIQAQSLTTGRQDTASLASTAAGVRARNEGLAEEMDWSPDFPTNSLWLQITGVNNGTASLVLNNATDTVYEVLSKTDLAQAGWNIEPDEVWPTNSIAMPFSVPVLGRTDTLFIWVRDWTSVTENGNQIPDWWFWKYFGTLALSDISPDSQGGTLLYDYQNGMNPNAIQFSLNFTNDYINSTVVCGAITVSSGTPVSMAVLINDTNRTDAVWQPYRSAVVANLNAGDGKYDVWVGLRGLPVDTEPVWLEAQLVLDTIPPTITITNPASVNVGQPMIQLQGQASESLSRLTFEVSNATGICANQTGHATGQFYNDGPAELGANWFQCCDVALAEGWNTVTLQATDLAGNTIVTNVNLILDYSSATNPPVLTVVWPQDGSSIAVGGLVVDGVPSGSDTFDLQAKLDDPTASVQAAISDTHGGSNTVQALVRRDGTVLAPNLRLGGTTNIITLTARNTAGYSSWKTLTVYKSDATVTLDPLASDQLNQSS